jgi:hypothetical protein
VGDAGRPGAGHGLAGNQEWPGSQGLAVGPGPGVLQEIDDSPAAKGDLFLAADQRPRLRHARALPAMPRDLRWTFSTAVTRAPLRPGRDEPGHQPQGARLVAKPYRNLSSNLVIVCSVLLTRIG